MSEVSSSPADVVVAGGGVIGLASAWRLALAGMRVTVVDPDAGEAASWVAAGMLAPETESTFGEAEMLRLNLAALQAFPDVVAELESVTGTVVGLRREGTMTVAHDVDDMVALRRLSTFRATLGLDTELLDGRACRRLEPLLAAGIQGGVLAVGDLSIDNRRYFLALRAACALAGVRIVTGRVASVNVVDGAVTGVRLDTGGSIAAPAVVLAAGSWSGQIQGADTWAPLPIRPVKGQHLRLRLPAGIPPVLTRTVRGVVEGRAVYLVPRADGEVVVGATVEERGYDRSVTAGAVHDLLRDASALLPVLAELVLAETGAGLRPGSPDNGPIVGRTSVEGLVVATGHYRGGILMSPITAEAVVAAVAGRPLVEAWAPFSPARFAASMAG